MLQKTTNDCCATEERKEELSGIKIAELRCVLEHAEKNLKIIYGQTNLRQAADIFDALPEDSASYSAH